MFSKAQGDWSGDRAQGAAGAADHRLEAVAMKMIWGNWRGLKKAFVIIV